MVVAKKLNELEATCASTILSDRTCLQKAGLELAEHKTHAVLISSRKKNNIRAGGIVIQSNTHIRYLGVVLDHRLNFKHHMDKTIEKAARATATLSRLMPNIGGPRQQVRKLLASVAMSMLMHAAPCKRIRINTKIGLNKTNKCL